MSSWETKFLEKMSETRAKELAALWARGLTMVVGGILTFGAPVVVSVATFIFHTKSTFRSCGRHFTGGGRTDGFCWDSSEEGFDG